MHTRSKDLASIYDRNLLSLLTKLRAFHKHPVTVACGSQLLSSFGEGPLAFCVDHVNGCAVLSVVNVERVFLYFDVDFVNSSVCELPSFLQKNCLYFSFLACHIWFDCNTRFID